MATYNITITTNAGEEKGLDFVVAKVNADRAAQNPPLSAITKTQYLQALANQLPGNYRQQYLHDFRDRCGVAMQSANATQLTQIASTLGVSE